MENQASGTGTLLGGQSSTPESVDRRSLLGLWEIDLYLLALRDRVYHYEFGQTDQPSPQTLLVPVPVREAIPGATFLESDQTGRNRAVKIDCDGLTNRRHEKGVGLPFDKPVPSDLSPVIDPITSEERPS